MKLVSENINSFIRNQNPIKSLGLGYEASIRAFFKQYDIPNGHYKVKKNGEIVFNGGLDLSNKNIVKFPGHLTINGSLWLNNSSIDSFGDNIYVDNNLWLMHSKITHLPNNLTVNGSIYLEESTLNNLPNNLHMINHMSKHIYVNLNQQNLIKSIKHSKLNDKLYIKF